MQALLQKKTGRRVPIRRQRNHKQAWGTCKESSKFLRAITAEFFKSAKRSHQNSDGR
jgi:hypothetical protein